MVAFRWRSRSCRCRAAPKCPALAWNAWRRTLPPRSRPYASRYPTPIGRLSMRHATTNSDDIVPSVCRVCRVILYAGSHGRADATILQPDQVLQEAAAAVDAPLLLSGHLQAPADPLLALPQSHLPGLRVPPLTSCRATVPADPNILPVACVSCLVVRVVLRSVMSVICWKDEFEDLSRSSQGLTSLDLYYLHNLTRHAFPFAHHTPHATRNTHARNTLTPRPF